LHLRHIKKHKPPSGAEVNVDYRDTGEGPDEPHIGW